MDIIKRNFFCIMRIGAFGSQETVEPMSKYKWNILEHIAKIHAVEDYVSNVMGWQHDYNDTKLPDAGLSHMSNYFLNKYLQQLRDTEPLAEDSSIETLNLLDIIVQSTEVTLNKGLLMSNIMRIGTFLRTDGDKVDFIKLEKWLRRLMLSKMAQLEGSILIQFFGFDKDEVPFVSVITPASNRLALESLDNPVNIDQSEWQFRQDSSVFVANNSKAMMKTFRNCMKYVYFSPIEVLSCFIKRFKMSISNLEE